MEHTQSLAVFASAPAVALPPSAIGKLAYLLQAAGCKLQVYKSCKIHFRKKPKPQYTISLQNTEITIHFFAAGF